MKSATWQHVHGGDVRATNHGPPLTMNALLVVTVVAATVFIGTLALLSPGPDVGVDRGLWLSPDRIGQLPMSGQAWDEVAA
ncbi:MAG: hypothetical protein OEZ14_17560, partial [Acidimicrobiia bacterium]|nr:hypothetical protein [Acidimicrobiia bacterium]